MVCQQDVFIAKQDQKQDKKLTAWINVTEKWDFMFYKIFRHLGFSEKLFRFSELHKRT